MNDIRNLSKEDFDKLKSTGLLYKIYPDAPENFEEIQGKRPIQKTNIDWTPVLSCLESILDDIENREWYDDDNEVYISESVVNAVYGESWFKFIKNIIQ